MHEDEPSAEPDANAGLMALIARAERAGRGAPPVERWNPAHCGDIDMVIEADGSWHHEGSPISRPALVRLFSSVLRKDEDGETYLVTPVERLRITVRDVAFLAVEMDRSGTSGMPVLTFRTNVGDVVEAGPHHPLIFRGGGEAFVPYLHVRGRLEARLTRSLAYDLASLAEEGPGGAQVLRSNGATFVLPDA